MILIDGNNLLYKVFYIGGGNLNHPTQLRKMFLNLVKSSCGMQINVSDYCKLNIVWDSSFGSWRHKEWRHYKANRYSELIGDEEPKKFFDFRTSLRQYIYHRTAFRQICINLYEADDVIAHMINNRKRLPEVIRIVSADKDFLQLLNPIEPHVYIRKIGSKQRYYNYADFKEEYGVEPYLWPHIRALSGDPSDNIPGVSGIGIKRATQIVKKYGPIHDWIDSVYRDGSPESNWAFEARLLQKEILLYFKLVDLTANHSNMRFSLMDNVYK